MLRIILIISVVITLLMASPTSTTTDKPTAESPISDETTASDAETTTQDISRDNNVNDMSATLGEKEDALQREFAEMIEKSLEQILGKNDIEEGPVDNMPCSNHNVEIMHPKIVDTVILEDKDVQAADREDIVKAVGDDKDNDNSIDDKSSLGSDAVTEVQPPVNHSLQKKDVSSTDRQQNDDAPPSANTDQPNQDATTSAKPETIIELMNRLKEEMAKTSMKELSPAVLETINSMTLSGRMDASTELPVERVEPTTMEAPRGPVPCTCGVFLSGQFKKGSKDQPKGVPVLTQEMDTPFLNNVVGNRQCTNKCLELIIKHLPKSSDIICATTDRDRVFKEKAYLFIKNWSDKWVPTNLSAGREFCCKENLPYKCPMS